MSVSGYHDSVTAARRLIEQRLDDPLSLEELSAEVGLSPFHFHRLFRGLTGETVAVYARRLRLQRAAQRLGQGADDILQIALDAGYGSHEAFTRAFTRQFGVSPSTFRQARRQTRIPMQHALWKEAPMDIRIENATACHIAFVRHVGPYEGVGEAWGQLMKWGWSKMIFGKPDTFGLCYDDPDVVAPEKIRYDACMAVKPGTRVKAPVETRDLPAGTFAVVEHVGPYEQFAEVYARLCGQLASEEVAGRRWRLADAPSREKYLNDPRKTRPEDLRTEIWMPVEQVQA